MTNIFSESQLVRRCQSRTPLQRFRISRKKNLTVSDLVTSAWCEMKFWYSLTRYGMVKKTPAMKQGTRIHRKLEEQVHVSVPVKVKIAEDTLGLQILNVIQGLRTLQKHGQTRELHVWGMVDGNLVGGKIDELSYSGPIIISSNKNEESDISKMQCAEKDTIDVLSTTDNTENTIASSLEKKFDPQSVYLSDVKTRSVRRLPSDTEFRPTKYQLMLYHRFISILATDKFDLSILTSHFNLDPHKIFSDEFLAQVNSLEEEENTRFIDGNDLNYQQTQSMILKHNNISALWSLMISEFQSAFPNGVESLGNTLIVEFRLAKNGKIIGTKTFPMDDLDLTAYLKHAMEWWNGERPPQGVTIEEAYKCRTCEFADACNWRLQKAEESRIQFRRKRSHTVNN